jgi:hypothetical protein
MLLRGGWGIRCGSQSWSSCSSRDSTAADKPNGSNHLQKLVVIKSVQAHFRLANERDVLRRLNGLPPYIRPLLDEITDPAEPTTIVLRHLEDHLLRASIERTLNRKELKYVSRRILEALQTMHGEGFVRSGTELQPREPKALRTDVDRC